MTEPSSREAPTLTDQLAPTEPPTGRHHEIPGFVAENPPIPPPGAEGEVDLEAVFSLLTQVQVELRGARTDAMRVLTSLDLANKQIDTFTGYIRQEIELHKLSTETELTKMEARMKHTIENVRQEFDLKIQQLRMEMGLG